MTQKYALIASDGMVRGFLSDDVNPEIPAGAVPITDDAWKDWIANPETRVWREGKLIELEPEPLSPPASIRVITARELRERFTRDERGFITLAASRALEADDPSLQVFLDDLNAAGTVELDHPDLLAGVGLLVALKLITQRRAEQILAAVPAV
jgi:hypothetical protein